MDELHFPGFVSIVASFGMEKVPANTIDVFYFDRNRLEYFPPPLNSFTEQNHIDDAFWIFQLKPRRVDVSPIYIAILHNCWVMPDGIVVTSDGRILLESTYPDRPEAFTKNFSEKSSHHFEAIRNLAEPNVDDLEISTLNRAVHCREKGEAGYFHWLASVLPRLMLVKQRFDGQTGSYLISTKTGFRQKWIDLIDSSLKIHQTSQHPIFVKELIFPAPAQVGDSHYTRNSILLKEFRASLAEHGLPKKNDGNQNPRRKLYISRNDAPVRRLGNEEELINKLRPLGFELLLLDNMSIVDQINAFSSAEIIVGPHGAGLTNILFCQNSTNVVEIMSVARTWPGFKVISQAVGANYHCYVSNDYDKSSSEGMGFGNENFNVNVESCLRLIESCL